MLILILTKVLFEARELAQICVRNLSGCKEMCNFEGYLTNVYLIIRVIRRILCNWKILRGESITLKTLKKEIELSFLCKFSTLIGYLYTNFIYPIFDLKQNS